MFVHGLQVGVGGVAHLLGCGVVQQLAHQRVLGGGEGQIVVVRGHPPQRQGLHLARAAQVVPLRVPLVLGRPFTGGHHQQRGQTQQGCYEPSAPAQPGQAV